MSVRLTLAKVLARALAKPAMRRQKSPEQARKALDLAARWLLRDPPGTNAMPWNGNSLRVSVGAETGPGVILYFHGGGYIAGSPATHRAMLARLGRMTGLPAILPDYPLAPEHPAPAGFEAALDAPWMTPILPKRQRKLHPHP